MFSYIFVFLYILYTFGSKKLFLRQANLSDPKSPVVNERRRNKEANKIVDVYLVRAL